MTAACGPTNVELLSSLGADHVIYYSREDFTKTGRRYDLIIDAGDRSLSDCRHALSPTGTFVPVGGAAGRWINGMGRAYKVRMLSPFVRQRLCQFLTRWSRRDLDEVRELIEAGHITPVIRPDLPPRGAATPCGT